MFNNPYLGGFNYPQSYPQFPQQEKQAPVQNIFTSQQPIGSEYFMAKILQNNQTAETEIVTQRTAFIDLNNKKLSIKEVDGNIKSYEIVLPLDEKDKKIIELENQINELKGMMSNGFTQSSETNTEISEPTGSARKNGRK